MKKPFLLFAVKCSVILYFTACIRLEKNFTGYQSATPLVTEGACTIHLFRDANRDQTNDYAGYTFTFKPGGNIIAGKKGVYVNGYWSEDNISKKIAINLRTNDPALARLNQSWNITGISDDQVYLEQNKDAVQYTLNINAKNR